MSARAGLGLALLVMAGCARGPGPVPLTDTWPDRPGDLEQVNRAWTRHGTLRGQYQMVLDVHAVFRSPSWWAAHAARQARIRKLDDAGRTALLDEAREAAAGDYQVALVVTTYDRRENDLDRGDRSIWRLRLVDDAGVETAPSQVKRDRRPVGVLRAELGPMSDFARVYQVHFPRSAGVLHDGARRVTLKMWSEHGGVELVWHAAGS